MREHERGVTFMLPLPPRECHPNARHHWRVRAFATSAYREEVAGEAKRQLGVDGIPHYQRARVELTYYTRRPMDRDGLTAWSKSLLDTLCGPAYALDPTPRLGIIPNDSDKHLELVVRREQCVTPCGPRVEVRVTPLA